MTTNYFSSAQLMQLFFFNDDVGKTQMQYALSQLENNVSILQIARRNHLPHAPEILLVEVDDQTVMGAAEQIVVDRALMFALTNNRIVQITKEPGSNNYRVDGLTDPELRFLRGWINSRDSAGGVDSLLVELGQHIVFSVNDLAIIRQRLINNSDTVRLVWSRVFGDVDLTANMVCDAGGGTSSNRCGYFKTYTNAELVVERKDGEWALTITPGKSV